MPMKSAVDKVLGDLIDKETVFHFNPTGNFVIGGPDGDTGPPTQNYRIIMGVLSLRRWCFSGKDPPK